MPLQENVIEFEQEVLLNDGPKKSAHVSECAIAIQGIEVAKSLSLADFLARQSLVETKDPNALAGALWNYLYVIGNNKFAYEGSKQRAYFDTGFALSTEEYIEKPTQGMMDAITYMQQHGSIELEINDQIPHLNMMLIIINDIRVGDKIKHNGQECIVCSINPYEQGAKHIFSSHYIALAIDAKTKKAYAVDLRTAQKAV